jgi:hypothetical protein
MSSGLTIRITVHETKPSIWVQSIADLDKVIASVSKEARTEDLLSIVLLEADNGNCISLVVGGDETVLGFTYGHLDPPYYASKGKDESDEPVMTTYAFFRHHTEFSRKSVISMKEGTLAVYEFFETSDLPKCIEWAEV